MGFFDQLSPAAAGSIPGAIMGIAFQGMNDRRQLRQQQKLQDMQIQGQMQMSDYNYAKQLQMWKDTSYGPQKEMMKMAGLNPALMYGMGGGSGGSTGTPSGQVSGAQAPVGGRELQDMMGMGIQSSMMQSQIDLLKAQARNLNVDADKKEGVDTQKVKSEIDNLIANTEDTKARAYLTSIQSDLLKIELEIKDKTKEDTINIVGQQLEEMFNRVEKAHRENLIGNETANDLVKGIKAEMAGKVLHNLLTKAEIATERTKPGLIKAQTATEKGKPAVQTQEIRESEGRWNKLIRDGVQKWEELRLSGQHVNNETTRVALEQWLEDVRKSDESVIDLFKAIGQGIIFKQILSPGSPNPVKGFSRK